MERVKPIGYDAIFGKSLTCVPVSWQLGDGNIYKSKVIEDSCRKIGVTSGIELLSHYLIADEQALKPPVVILNEGGNTGRRDILPTEFFNHELLEVNPGDEEQVCAFVMQYGFPFHPMRFGAGYFAYADTVPEDDDLESESEFIFFTDLIAEEAKSSGAIGLSVISLAEASASIAFMQVAVMELYKTIVLGEWPNGGPLHYLHFVNEASTSRTELVGDMPMRPIPASVDETTRKEIESLKLTAKEIGKAPNVRRKKPLDLDCKGVQHLSCTLTNAIANQIQDTVNDPEPWHICPECHHPYKHKHNEKGKPAATNRKQGGASYCSEKCRRAHNDRNSNARKKAKREAAKRTNPACKGDNNQRNMRIVASGGEGNGKGNGNTAGQKC